MTSPKTKLEVVLSEGEEVAETVEILADSIVKISNGFNKVVASGLNNRALVILLQDAIGASNITRTQILLVLQQLPELKDLYVKKKMIINN